MIMIIIIITIIEKINGKTLVLSRTFVFFRERLCSLEVKPALSGHPNGEVTA